MPGEAERPCTGASKVARVREQLPLEQAYQTNGRIRLRDAAAGDNKTLPIHRWVPWIAGFSAHFVEDAIDSFLPEKHRDRCLVLDPFAGVGTTLVEALKAGCNTVGYEINTFAWLAARSKLSCMNTSPDAFRAEIGGFRAAMNRFERDIDRRWASGGLDAILGKLGPLRSSGPADFRSRIPFFSPPVEAKFLYALKRTATLAKPYHALFRAALGATMITFSNYSYEPSLSSRPGAGKPLIENASVALPVCQKLDTMLEDIELAHASYGAKWTPRRHDMIHGSYFSTKLRARSVSLLVTSPPYMNNYHYIRNTRPQLYWLDLIQGPDEIRRSEQDSFGKFWQTVRQAKPIDLAFDFPGLQALIQKLRALNVERGPYGGPGWANYVATYFNDCDRFLDLASRQLKVGARAVIVVGNSIIQGIEFKVDELLAEVAERKGLTLEEIRIVRKKRVGNSIITSSVRNGASGGLTSKTQLYDAAVILRA